MGRSPVHGGLWACDAVAGGPVALGLCLPRATPQEGPLPSESRACCVRKDTVGGLLFVQANRPAAGRETFNVLGVLSGLSGWPPGERAGGHRPRPGEDRGPQRVAAPGPATPELQEARPVCGAQVPPRSSRLSPRTPWRGSTPRRKEVHCSYLRVIGVYSQALGRRNKEEEERGVSPFWGPFPSFV